MKKKTESLIPDCYYHVYNRGVNKTDIFIESRNYYDFLDLYTKYISPIADTFAYCLLKNHFHFLIRIKPEEEIVNWWRTVTHPVRVDADRVGDFDIPKYLSQQFSHMFNSYAQKINKLYDRSGSLFERPFQRILVEKEDYFTELIYYIHKNPQKHGFVSDFREYPYSSYHAFLLEHSNRIKKDEVLQWFGGSKSFLNYHGALSKELINDKILIDL